MRTKRKQLYSLNRLPEYKVASGYSDVRNWFVKDKNKRIIGKVKTLLVSLEAKQVVYIDVKVDNTIVEENYNPYKSLTNPEVRKFVNKDGENHVILPIDLVNIHNEKNFIYTDSIDQTTFTESR